MIERLKKSNGFSLVEIAVVLIIFGFAASTVALGLKTYTEEARKQKTEDSLNFSREAIANFVTLNNRYPCPADPNLGPGNLNYGVEIIEGMPTATPADQAAIDAALNTIDVRTRVDLDEDGTGEDYVVGSVPFNTLFNTNAIPGVISVKDVFREVDLSSSTTVDGYGNKVIYAVSRHLCDPLTALPNDARGVIDVVTGELPCSGDVDGNGTIDADETFEISLLPGEGVCKQENKRYAQFILLSLGENGRGGFTESGGTLETCVNTVVTPPPPGPITYANNPWNNGYKNDRVNCKFTEIAEDDPTGTNRGIFFAGLRNESENENFDDKIVFYFEDTSAVWQTAPTLTDDMGTADTSDDITITRINNVNQGELIIGDAPPDEVLNVNGDIQALDIQAVEYCDDDSLNTATCLDPNVLAGAGIECPNPGEYIDTIENSTVICGDPFTGNTYTCPAGEFLKLIRSDGDFQCCDAAGANCNTYSIP